MYIYMQEDRRILPRRSARNAALSNLKQITTPQRKPRSDKKETAEENVDAEAASHSEDDDFEDDDQEENAEIGSSDDEFLVKSKSSKKRYVGFSYRYCTLSRRRQAKPKQEPEDQESTSTRRRKPKPKPTVFEEESTDDDGEEEEKKVRRMANEKTLCQKCQKSSRPDVVSYSFFLTTTLFV